LNLKNLPKYILKKGGISHKRNQYLFVDVGSPKSVSSTIIRIRREDGRTGGPDVVNVLNNDEGLADGLVGMDESRDFLVDGIGSEKKLALRIQRLFKKLILNSFDVKGNPSPHHKWACP
jgi:hypothetical protein